MLTLTISVIYFLFNSRQTVNMVKYNYKIIVFSVLTWSNYFFVLKNLIASSQFQGKISVTQPRHTW